MIKKNYFKHYYIALILLLLTQGIMAQDSVDTIVGSDPVEAGSTASVTIGYTASVNRDLMLTFQTMGGTLIAGPIRTTVLATESSVDVQISIPSGVDIATDGFKYFVYMTTEGGGFAERILPTLQQLDVTTVPAGTLSVTDIENKGIQAKIFPNPVSNILYLKGLKLVDTELSVFNLLGQNMYNSKEALSKDIISLNTENFKSGVYILNIKQEGDSKQLKFIKH